jgi:hypothetical protein
MKNDCFTAIVLMLLKTIIPTLANDRTYYRVGVEINHP